MIAVLGGGAWGTALAHMLASENETVLLWARNAATVDEINDSHTNRAYLGDAVLADALRATRSLEEAVTADVVLCVTPAQTFATLAPQLASLMGPKSKLVLCAKGIDRESGRFLHELAAMQFGAERVAALSGPSFAHDVARGLPTAVSLAAHDLPTAQALATQVSTPVFRIYASDDLVGVEAGGALKNVLALAVGIARGLGLGASAEAALIARGFAEMNRIAMALGAKPETLSGLSGLGDLVLTCSSPQSRNFSYGMALAQGDDLSNLPLAEGVATAAMASQMAEAHNVAAPIVEAVTSVLEGELQPRDAVAQLLARPLRSE